jgi:hypothetical protein
MDQSLTPHAVFFNLNSQATIRDLDDATLARLAADALFYLGRGHGEYELSLSDLYPAYARRIPDARRFEIFARIRDHAFEGLLLGKVLAQFVRLDPAPKIVSTAALDMACLNVAESARAPRGAELVIDLVVADQVVNPGAALGGLLALGDRAVNRTLTALQPTLVLPGTEGVLAQFASCATGYVYAATIEFWLDWLEALAHDLPESRGAFEWVAHGLARQREAMLEHVVLEGKRIVPTPLSGTVHEPDFREIALDAFAASIASRLRTLAPYARDSDNFRRALTAWLGPRR